MSRIEVYELLKEATELDVCQDFVPETQSLPALSYFRIDSESSGTLEGNIDLRKHRYQVDVMTNTSRLDCDKIANKIRALDGNTDKPFWQKISIIRDQDVPPFDPNVKVFQISLDIELVPRSSALL